MQSGRKNLENINNTFKNSQKLYIFYIVILIQILQVILMFIMRMNIIYYNIYVSKSIKALKITHFVCACVLFYISLYHVYTCTHTHTHI